MSNILDNLMKVVNFFGAPGAGKTTMTMDLTSRLRRSQIDAEASLEFVKEYIHSNSEHLLAYQNYIFAQQERQLRILDNSNEVEFAITDSPLLLSSFYAPEKYPVFFKELVFEIFNSYENINYFIHRNHPYVHQGRVHDEKRSNEASVKMRAFLINHSIPFIEMQSTDSLDSIFKSLLNEHRVENYENTRKRR
jgi:nicotinamide riboside kinase